jgi:hypothetical protein
MRTKEQSAAYSLKYNKKHREENRQREKRSRREDPRSAMVRNAKYRALKKGREFTITKEDFEIPKTCPVLGLPIFVSDERLSDNSPTIDRVDNSKGYTKDNIMCISFKANSLKGEGNIADFKKIIEYIEKHIQKEKEA